MDRDQPIAGFDLPRPAKDKYARDLYKKYGLSATPSMAEIEPIATELLENPMTLFRGVGLVLGRRVGARERDIINPVFFIGNSGEDRFSACLLLREIDEQEKNQGAR